MAFEQLKRVLAVKSSILEVTKKKITIWAIIEIFICFLGKKGPEKSILHGWRITKEHLNVQKGVKKYAFDGKCEVCL